MQVDLRTMNSLRFKKTKRNPEPMRASFYRWQRPLQIGRNLCRRMVLEYKFPQQIIFIWCPFLVAETGHSL
jgi:hypothetical protein